LNRPRCTERSGSYQQQDGDQPVFTGQPFRFEPTGPTEFVQLACNHVKTPSLVRESVRDDTFQVAE
jgi:hypothetical protein